MPGICAAHGMPTGLTDPADIATVIRLLKIGRDALRDDDDAARVDVPARPHWR
jgi:hypothetical protein